MVFKSKVIKGEGLGKKIGFPTLNLQVPAGLAEGVYACRIFIDRWYRGVLHLGKKSVGSKQQTCEVHVLGFRGKASEVTVEVKEKIREVRKFRDVEELKRQIGRDVAKARGAE